MNIVYKNQSHFSNVGDEVEKSLSEIVEGQSYDYYGSETSQAKDNAKNAIKFCEAIVDVLYVKKIFNNKDIKKIMGNFMSMEDNFGDPIKFKIQLK